MEKKIFKCFVCVLNKIMIIINYIRSNILYYIFEAKRAKWINETNTTIHKNSTHKHRMRLWIIYLSMEICTTIWYASTWRKREIAIDICLFFNSKMKDTGRLYFHLCVNSIFARITRREQSVISNRSPNKDTKFLSQDKNIFPEIWCLWDSRTLQFIVGLN